MGGGGDSERAEICNQRGEKLTDHWPNRICAFIKTLKNGDVYIVLLFSYFLNADMNNVQK